MRSAPLGGSEGYLLYDYPGATGAFSLFDLSGTNPAVVRVEETGGNTQADFTEAEITDGTLLSFCGANSGRVVTWYNQGFGSDATATVDGPLLVENGVLITNNGEPSLEFTGSGSQLNIANPLISSAACSVHMVLGTPSGSDQRAFAHNLGSLFVIFRGYTSYVDIYLATGNAFRVTPLAQQQLITVIAIESVENRGYLNGEEIAGSPFTGIGFTTTGTGPFNYIGSKRDGSSDYWVGLISELVVYDSDKRTDQAAIDGNIMTRWGL
jgi:hypothetical protein